MTLSSVQFSCSSRVHGPQHAWFPCPSPAPGACSDSCPLSQCCHPTISSSVDPFSSPLQSFPASGSFPGSQLFASGGLCSRVTPGSFTPSTFLSLPVSRCVLPVQAPRAHAYREVRLRGRQGVGLALTDRGCIAILGLVSSLQRPPRGGQGRCPSLSAVFSDAGSPRLQMQPPPCFQAVPALRRGDLSSPAC